MNVGRKFEKSERGLRARRSLSQENGQWDLQKSKSGMEI